MIDIGAVDFYFPAPTLSKGALETYSLELFDRWELNVESKLFIPDYSLSLVIEEGSIKGKGYIYAALTTLYFAIGNYGSFISGLQTISAQVVTVSDFLTKTAEQPLIPNLGEKKIRKQSGTLGALQRLFVKVQRGEITPEQATKEAEILIGEDAKDSPEFMASLAKALAQAPQYHQQVPLPLEYLEKFPLGSRPEKDRARRQPSAPPWPISTHLRVEVWRESKKQQKNFRIVNV